MDTKTFNFNFDVTIAGAKTRDVTARNPKIGDLIDVKKMGFHEEEIEAALAAHLIGVAYEEYREWPAAAYLEVGRWLRPLVGLSGATSGN